jgi:four helix bundle protein
VTQSEADFLTKMSIACKEARETHYWIRLLVASELVDIKSLEGLEQESNEIVAILSTICKRVKEKRS